MMMTNPITNTTNQINSKNIESRNSNFEKNDGFNKLLNNLSEQALNVGNKEQLMENETNIINSNVLNDKNENNTILEGGQISTGLLVDPELKKTVELSKLGEINTQLNISEDNINNHEIAKIYNQFFNPQSEIEKNIGDSEINLNKMVNKQLVAANLEAASLFIKPLYQQEISVENQITQNEIEVANPNNQKLKDQPVINNLTTNQQNSGIKFDLVSPPNIDSQKNNNKNETINEKDIIINFEKSQANKEALNKDQLSLAELNINNSTKALNNHKIVKEQRSEIKDNIDFQWVDLSTLRDSGTTNIKSDQQINGKVISNWDMFTSNLKTAISNGNNHLRVKLEPEKLGSLDFRLSKNSQGKLSAVLNIDNSQIVDFLKNQSDKIHTILLDQGIKLDNLVIHLNENNSSQNSEFAFDQQQQAFSEEDQQLNQINVKNGIKVGLETNIENNEEQDDQSGSSLVDIRI